MSDAFISLAIQAMGGPKIRDKSATRTVVNINNSRYIDIYALLLVIQLCYILCRNVILHVVQACQMSTCV